MNCSPLLLFRFGFERGQVRIHDLLQYRGLGRGISGKPRRRRRLPMITTCLDTRWGTRVLFSSSPSNFLPIMKNFPMTDSPVLPGRVSSRTFPPQTASRYCCRVSCGSWFIISCYLPSVESYDKLVDFALQPGCCHSCMLFSYVHHRPKHFTSVLHLVRILSWSSLLFFLFSLCSLSLASLCPHFRKHRRSKTPVKYCYSSP